MDPRTILAITAVAGYVGGAAVRDTMSGPEDSDSERLLWAIAGAIAAAWLVARVKG